MTYDPDAFAKLVANNTCKSRAADRYDAKYAVQKYALTHAKAMVERDRRLEDLEAENARLRAALRETLATIETKNLGDRMCCDGQMCGCQGSTNGDWLEYIIRAALGESHG